jgi:hypothetical protein
MISRGWAAEAENPVGDARRDSGWTSSEVKRELGSGQQVTIIGVNCRWFPAPATTES